MVSSLPGLFHKAKLLSDVMGTKNQHLYTLPPVKSTKAWKKLSTWTSVQDMFVCNHTKQPDHYSDYFEHEKDEECDERDQLLPQAVIRFDHLRKPLMEA